VETGLRQFHRERQADVAEPDDTGSGAAGLDLFPK
jgi:hypothetical protein